MREIEFFTLWFILATILGITYFIKDAEKIKYFVDAGYCQTKLPDVPGVVWGSCFE